MASFTQMYNKWSDDRASKKIIQAIESGNVDNLYKALERKPQNFQYVLWGTHPDNPRNEKTPLMVYGNPIVYAQQQGKSHMISLLEQAGYINPNKPTTPQNKFG